MKKEDINEELISKIEVQIDDTLFYMPGETVKGKILINPKYQMKIKDKMLHLNLKIMQYEFWEYSKVEVEELKNIYSTNIQEENIEYELNDELALSNSGSFEHFSIIEKEAEDKIISIPFQRKISDKILPTFQYEDNDYILGIRHLLIVEYKEYNSSNYIGLFIGKNKNLDFTESKEIKETYQVGLGTLDIIAKYPKLCYKLGEEIKLDIRTYSNLHFKKITEIQQTFYRKIEWVGIMKNTVLDRHIFDIQKYKYNEDEYELLNKLMIPITPVVYSVSAAVACPIGGMVFGFSSGESIEGGFFQGLIGGAFGVLLSPIGFLGGLYGGIYRQGQVVKDILNLNDNINNMNNKFVSKLNSPEHKKWLVNNLKKFVFFKENKVVGFIKFAQNITPPINGYYFQCNYNIKIEVQIAGIILNRNRYLKTLIDVYDSDEYISNMKKIFKNEI